MRCQDDGKLVRVPSFKLQGAPNPSNQAKADLFSLWNARLPVRDRLLRQKQTSRMPKINPVADRGTTTANINREDRRIRQSTPGGIRQQHLSNSHSLDR